MRVRVGVRVARVARAKSPACSDSRRSRARAMPTCARGDAGAALRVIAHLIPSEVYPLVPIIVAHLTTAAADVKEAACLALSGIEPVALLASVSGNLKPATVEILLELHSTQLAVHAASVMGRT